MCVTVGLDIGSERTLNRCRAAEVAEVKASFCEAGEAPPRRRLADEGALNIDIVDGPIERKRGLEFSPGTDRYSRPSGA